MRLTIKKILEKLKLTTIAGRMTLLIAGLSVFITLIGCYIILQYKYDSSRQKFLGHYQNLIANTSNQMQLAIHYQDYESLDKLVDEYLKNDPVEYVSIYNAGGKLLVERDRHQNNKIEHSVPNLEALRDGLKAYEMGQRSRRDPRTGTPFIDLSYPFFSLVSPLNTDIREPSYMQLLLKPQKQNISHFAGYVNLGLDTTGSNAKLDSFTRNIAVSSLVFILTAILVTLISTRRIIKPLNRLATMTDDISLGKLNTVPIKGSSEIQMIATRLNVIIDQLASHKTNLDVDNKLLSLKVDERTVELSARNEELNQAIKQVTDTKNRLRRLAYFDSLTGLPNRRSFNEKLQLLLSIAKREKHILALLFIDIDNFKRINDSLGHDAGDQLLKEIAVRLKNNIRESDILDQDITQEGLVSRFGGDEFTAILSKVDTPQSPGLVAERLLTELSRPIIIGKHEVVVTPSIGISLAPEHGDNSLQLLKHADTAMYHAKSAGKNSYLYYNQDMEETNIERLELEIALRKAIDNNELELHFQPQVNIETGLIVGAEVLLRWEHPELGSIPPFEFVSMAEQAGYIGELGDWVLVAACRHMKTIQEKGFSLPNLSINVSSLQFTDSFGDRVREVLDEVGLESKSIVIELTEGLVMRNAHEAIKRLQELKNVGVGLSVDDFGTGYSSLSYLTRFPLNELKIDRSFITDIDKSTDNAGVVSAIISMGRSLNLNLVAEGVETAGELAFLKKNGVNIIQGYLFSKPVNISDFHELLEGSQFTETIEQISSQFGSE